MPLVTLMPGYECAACRRKPFVPVPSFHHRIRDPAPGGAAYSDRTFLNFMKSILSTPSTTLNRYLIKFQSIRGLSQEALNTRAVSRGSERPRRSAHIPQYACPTLQPQRSLRQNSAQCQDPEQPPSLSSRASSRHHSSSSRS